MIDKTGGVDRALAVHLNKTTRINGADPDGRSARRDAVTISKFSALVERGRACALALPDLRADRVSQARSSLESGEITGSSDVASAIINSAVEGRV
jgi:hypothetical protein